MGYMIIRAKNTILGVWSYSSKAVQEFSSGHPDLRALQAPEIPAVKAGIIIGPHHPPGEHILPKLSKTT